MKKKLLTILLILLVFAAYGTYRLGDRSITINVDGSPAAGRKIRMFKSGEILELDDTGSLDLAWGLKNKEHPAFFFQSGPKNVWVLRMPDKGSVTFNIEGAEVITDAEMSLGLFKLKRQITQTHTPQPPAAEPAPPADEGAPPPVDPTP